MAYVIPTQGMICDACDHLKKKKEESLERCYRHLQKSITLIMNRLGFPTEDLILDRSIHDKVKDLVYPKGRNNLRRRWQITGADPKEDPEYWTIFNVCHCQCFRRFKNATRLREQQCKCNPKPRMHGLAAATNFFDFFLLSLHWEPSASGNSEIDTRTPSGVTSCGGFRILQTPILDCAFI